MLLLCMTLCVQELRSCNMKASQMLCPAGRLNILANVVRKPMQQIFAEFGGMKPQGESYYGTGDVKYHLGTSYDRPTVSGKRVHLSLLANPSHLEVGWHHLPNHSSIGINSSGSAC